MLRISVKLTALALLWQPRSSAYSPDRSAGATSATTSEEAEGQAQSRNLELISSVSKLRLAGAETAAARWWGQEFLKIVALENALDAKEATAALLRGVMPNLGTLLVYIVITRLMAEQPAVPVSMPECRSAARILFGFRHVHRLRSWFRRIADRSL